MQVCVQQYAQRLCVLSFSVAVSGKPWVLKEIWISQGKISADRLSELHPRQDRKSCAEGFWNAAKYGYLPANGLHYVSRTLMVTNCSQVKVFKLLSFLFWWGKLDSWKQCMVRVTCIFLNVCGRLLFLVLLPGSTFEGITIEFRRGLGLGLGCQLPFHFFYRHSRSPENYSYWC